MEPCQSAGTYDRLEQTVYTRAAVEGLSVAVVGCGALGAEVARLLGLLGVSRVLLIDPDVVEQSNRTHSPYLRHREALGRAKVEVLAEGLYDHFPATAWNTLPVEIADAGFNRLRACGLVFSCTDSALARVETTYAARRLQLPLVDGAMKGRAYWAGRVSWFPANDAAACYLCQMSEARRAEILALSLSAAQRCSAAPAENLRLASTPTMASIVAGLQVDLGLRLALDTTSGAAARGWELRLPMPETGWRDFRITRGADCPWHEQQWGGDLMALPPDRPLRETLATLQDAVLLLDWPLCLRARCAMCGYAWAPLLRLAAVRRKAVCPHCAGTRLHPIETLLCVKADDPIAGSTPRDLGLPEDHLFTIGGASPAASVR